MCFACERVINHWGARREAGRQPLIRLPVTLISQHSYLCTIPSFGVRAGFSDLLPMTRTLLCDGTELLFFLF